MSSRLWVRNLLRSGVFPLASPLPSTPPWPSQAQPRSAASSVLRNCPTSRLRASSACVLGLSDAVCDFLSHRRTRDLPVSAQGACVHAQGLRPRRVQKRLALTTLPVLPSASFNGVGTQKWPALAYWWFNFAAPYLACTYPVNASPSPLPTNVHDSEPVWIATPSLYETFIHNTLPAFTGASERFELALPQVDVIRCHYVIEDATDRSAS
jgi:hypothetical protein